MGPGIYPASILPKFSQHLASSCPGPRSSEKGPGSLRPWNLSSGFRPIPVRLNSSASGQSQLLEEEGDSSGGILEDAPPLARVILLTAALHPPYPSKDTIHLRPGLRPNRAQGSGWDQDSAGAQVRGLPRTEVRAMPRGLDCCE